MYTDNITEAEAKAAFDVFDTDKNGTIRPARQVQGRPRASQRSLPVHTPPTTSLCASHETCCDLVNLTRVSSPGPTYRARAQHTHRH